MSNHLRILFSALLLASGCGARAADIQVVRAPADLGANGYYVGNRPPLLPNPLIKLPPGSVQPGGWLRHQLELQAKGFSGRLAEISSYCRFEGNGWTTVGSAERAWEEVPYWLRGQIALGYALHDRAIIAEVSRWMDAVISTAHPDGYFGSRSNLVFDGGRANVKPMIDLWPNMLMLFPLRSMYEVTGDERILRLMTRYFRWQASLPREEFIPRSWQKIRGGDNLDSIHWLYNRTGEPWLLDLARVNHERTADWTSGLANWHNVNFAQCFREPAQFYQQARQPGLLEATLRNYRTMMDLYGQVPGGGFGSDEIARPGFHGPRQGTETCGWVELMFSHERLTEITGDPTWADRAEEVAFNSLPAAMTPDLKGLHYITAPNQIQLDSANKAPMVQRSGDMYSYDSHGPDRCCQHNSGFGWPYFAQYAWMATRDNGLAAVFYAPGRVTARVADGANVSIAETTDYPFDETVTFRFSVDRPVRFPLLLRVPGWCGEPAAALNGKPLTIPDRARGWLVVDRTWREGDEVRLTLPMRVTTQVWTGNRNAMSVRRGPLSYSLKIQERWQRRGGTTDWPAYEVYPASPWNYGLIADLKNSAASFRVVKTKGPLAGQPFANDSAPITLRAKARRIPQWRQEPNGMIGEVQPGPVRSDRPVEEVTLVPMGGARLRVSVFPRISGGAEARVWRDVAPIVFSSSSGHFEPPSAVNDGVIPGDAGARGVRRFVWVKPGQDGNWIEFRYSSPVQIESSAVYWADDGDNCRLPESWQVAFLDGGDWRVVEGTAGYPIRRNEFSTTRFSPVTTTAIRLQVKVKDQRTAGIFEWRVD